MRTPKYCYSKDEKRTRQKPVAEKEEAIRVRVIVIPPYDRGYTVYYNDKRPWWKCRRARIQCPAGRGHCIDMPEGMVLELDKLFIKFEYDEELKPLKDFCEYR